jgi:cyclopropane-fatty-acyl-phospholipid synthase
MNMLARLPLAAAEMAAYGPAYGYLNYLIRSPQPLEAESTWQRVAGDPPAAANWIRNAWPPVFLRGALIAAKKRQDHVLGISAHYDVSNDFYELFLDKKYMFYSCADFITGRETLEEAQQNKADFILRLIDPQPGEKILELGCGWGPMLKRIYEATGDKENLCGYTLSKEQVAYNETHNGFQVEFRNFVTSEFPTEAYDKIYSIGAWEHVRPQEVPQLLGKLYRALKPGGRLVQHFFCRLQEAYPPSAVVSQIFFPGSVNSSLRYQIRACEAAGFRVAHASIHDYRPTLRAWFDNLERNRRRALELVDVATFNRYMVFFPASWRYFHEMTGFVVRLRLEKQA